MTARSEDLVPQGLPHGERQRTENIRALAGLPDTSSQIARSGPSASGPAAASTRTRPAVAQGAGSGFDALLSTQPPPAPVPGAPGADPLANLKARLSQSQNPIVREIVALMGEHLE